MHSDRRKSMRTNTTPTKIPITTHNFNPKIEVFFDNSLLTNAASYTDIFFSNQNHFSASVFSITSSTKITTYCYRMSNTKKRNTEMSRFLNVRFSGEILVGFLVSNGGKIGLSAVYRNSVNFEMGIFRWDS